MRMVGPSLFAGANLARLLSTRLTRVAPKAVFEVCGDTARPSRLKLRRALVAAASFDPGIDLGKPGPIKVKQVTDFGNVEAICVIPIPSDPELFSYSAPAWPPRREVRGWVRLTSLMLQAEAGRQQVAWLPALFAAEIAMIEQHAAAQADLIRRYHVELDEHVATLVERIYPVLNARELRNLDDGISSHVPERARARRQVWQRLLAAV